VTARLSVSGEPSVAQVAARLWDVSPDGRSQTLVARGLYRPSGRAGDTWQLHANGWRFAPGHVPKLELLGSDPPYARPSNQPFSIDVAGLELRLPVREAAGAAEGALSRRCASRRRFRIRLRALRGERLRSAVVRVNGRRVRVVRGRRLRAVVDLRGLPRGVVEVRIVARTRSGRRVVRIRRYRTCTPRRSRPVRRPRGGRSGRIATTDLLGGF
jgi:hypothetical protein